MLKPIERFFGDRVREKGPTPAAVDYNSLRSQEIRFEQLCKLMDASRAFSLNDYGCGYGALAHYLRDRGFRFAYCGLDISRDMTEAGRALAPAGVPWGFVNRVGELPRADYTVASGTFNLKLDAERGAWEALVLEALDTMAGVSRRGFGFNMLTSYSDRELMRTDLYYGSPVFFFDHCKRKFSRNVALLHDYGLYDFTILVRSG
jgi:SAM-dependent methyltransferase